MISPFSHIRNWGDVISFFYVMKKKREKIGHRISGFLKRVNDHRKVRII